MKGLMKRLSFKCVAHDFFVWKCLPNHSNNLLLLNAAYTHLSTIPKENGRGKDEREKEIDKVAEWLVSETGVGDIATAKQFIITSQNKST